MKTTRAKNKLHFGVGVNDCDEQVVIGHGPKRWVCPIYSIWHGMIERCYSDKFKEKRPTYADCEVCDEWKFFSNFKRWAEHKDRKGMHLDKDILFYGNKVYCPERCVFVDALTNTFMNEYRNGRGKYMIGVDLHSQCTRFRARCSNPFTGKNEYLGLYVREIDAHHAWKKRKLELAVKIAEMQSDSRVAKALIDRYS